MCPSTTPVTCVDSYERVNNAFSHGGTRIPNLNSARECEDWCTGNRACGAFDINSLNECYWHKDREWEDALGSGSGVTQYRKVPCDPSGGTLSVTGGTGTDQSFAALAFSAIISVARTSVGSTRMNVSGCEDTFEASVGMFASGGSRDVRSDSVNECEVSCLRARDCFGFDFNDEERSCWLHDDRTVFNNLQIDTSNVITNYQRIPCGESVFLTEKFKLAGKITRVLSVIILALCRRPQLGHAFAVSSPLACQRLSRLRRINVKFTRYFQYLALAHQAAKTPSPERRTL